MVASALRLGARYQRRNHGLEPAWGILRSTSEREGIWGHPFMTSTRREEGVRLRWTHVDGGRGSSPHVDVLLWIINLRNNREFREFRFSFSESNRAWALRGQQIPMETTQNYIDAEFGSSNSETVCNNTKISQLTGQSSCK